MSLSISMVSEENKFRISTFSFVTPLLLIGIPVKYFPEDNEKMKAVQYSALISNLVMQTKYTLDHIEGKPGEGGSLRSGFHSLRMRTA